MKNRYSILILLAFLTTGMILSGCGVNQAEPATTNTASVIPTETKISTQTREPSPQPTNTKTATSTPEVNPSETAVLRESEQTETPSIGEGLDNFSNAETYNYGFLDNWQFFVSVQADQPIKGEYYALVGEQYKQKRYSCTVIPNYPNRLYCSGDLARVEDWVDFTVYSIDSDNPVYQGRVSIPFPYNVYPSNNE